MNVDEIQSVQSRERQTDSLQQLRDSFYEEAGQFVRALREERQQIAASADDPFDTPEVNRLSDDIATAEQTLEAIYERRVGKIVKMASLAAADMPTEEDGLTREERDLFESLVGAIESNRAHVFDVLEGVETGSRDAIDPPPSKPSPSETAEGNQRPDPGESTATRTDSPDHTDVSAADLMGADEESSSRKTTPASPDRQTDPEHDRETTSDESTRIDGGAPQGAGSEEGGEDVRSLDGRTAVERTTVKITADVGEILGVDDRSYDLATNDIVRLPDLNAKPLLEQGVAERLD